jgi:phage terminase large subunit GpA-like protein
MQVQTKSFSSLDEIFVSLAAQLQPPERITPSQAAEKYRYVNQPGAYVGPWRNSTTRYMVEPMDTFASYNHNGLIFVGPSQSAKTDGLIINEVLYSAKVDPLDMMIVCPTMTEARDFSIRRIDRLHRHTKAMRELVIGSHGDNTFDKTYSNGMLLTITWPSSSTLAGKPIGRVVLTDRDRMPDDIDGDGEPFDLASKRTTTFGSYAMTVAESSPSRMIENGNKWIAKSLHEAPPAPGILALYNRGDRRRWYWPCPECNQYFEGKFDMLTYDDWKGATNLERAETVRLICPHCRHKIHPDDRDDMQQWGIWLKDGQGIDKQGRVFGPKPRTRIASFWLNGVAAAFISWKALVSSYLDAMQEYERTGSEEALKKFYNNDLGEPYYPKSTMNMRLPEVLKARAERLGERTVPADVRFLVATVDVQQNMFVVQVHGIRPGRPYDIVVIDHFDVRKSKRTDSEGERLWVKPHSYLEDWDELVEHVIDKEYMLGDDSGRAMSIKFVTCDSGGKDGVTTKAYEFHRELVKINKHRRFMLVRGDHTPNRPRARITTPDSNRKDEKAVARGDVPVLQLNSNVLKDDLNGRLDCIVPGKGMIYFPDWLSDKFYAQLCSEVRTSKGWENPTRGRNEAWDLLYYCLGICTSELLRVESIDWTSPPSWACEWDKNDLVRQKGESRRFATDNIGELDFAEFGKALA